MATQAADKPYAPSKSQNPVPNRVTDDKGKKWNKAPLHGQKNKGATTDYIGQFRGSKRK